MNATDLKKGDRVTVRYTIGGRAQKGTIIEVKSKKSYGDWYHKILLDVTPTVSPPRYKYEKDAIQNVDGQERYIVDATSRNIKFKLDENDNPLLSASQLAARKIQVKRAIKDQKDKDAAESLCNKLALLGIDSYIATAFGKRGNHICIPFIEVQKMLDIVGDSINDQIKDMMSALA